LWGIGSRDRCYIYICVCVCVCVCVRVCVCDGCSSLEGGVHCSLVGCVLAGVAPPNFTAPWPSVQRTWRSWELDVGRASGYISLLLLSPLSLYLSVYCCPSL